MVSASSRSPLVEPQLHVVVLVHRSVAEARDLLVAADHEAQRLRDVLGVDAQVGGALAVDLDAQLRLVELERGVGVERCPAPAHRPAQLLGVARASVSRSGPRSTKSMSKLPPPMLNACALRTAVRRSRKLAQAPADLLHHVALGVVALERAPAAGRGVSRAAAVPSEKVRSSCGAMRT